MAKKRLGRNMLPLLAITALLLSVGLVNYENPSFLGSQTSQSVLSDSDEKPEENKEEKKEEKKEERTEERKREEKRSAEAVRVENKGTRVRVEVKNKVNTNDTDDVGEVGDVESDENESEVESEFEEETETESADGVTSKYKLKIKTKTVNGKTVVETTAGEVEVENSPDDTVNDLIEDGVLDTPVAFETKTKDDKVEFEFKGVEAKKLLGLFDIELPKTVTVDANSGEVLSTNRSIWTRFLNLLSI